ncbi:uncharacterized protein LOC111380781 [Olea europaea var. sylvestris]|uniref:uncharacterized protein LOC111380781 n=1 Tax=Olea europaea var. sylvestris TaxID=158386 RepID=UPI000C1D6CCD|nr:uncharacterized protein LOC111380781 [Olea europaea var. sylvestris]
MRGLYEEHCNALDIYQKPYIPYPETYNAGWEHHPNFSWKFENQQSAQSNRAYNVSLRKPTSSRNSLEDTLHLFIEAHVQAQPSSKGQHVAQISGSRETNFKEVNAITTRSRKVIERALQSRENEKDPNNSEESIPSEEVVKNPSRVHFPQALKSTLKFVGQHSEILEHLKQVKINLSLLHMISQVPTYAKVLKDFCTVKKKHHVKKTTFLTKHVSTVFEKNIPLKYKDPGCPTVSCIIGNHEISQAFLDLGASVNIMPYDTYLLLRLGEMKPTSVSLQLADRSTIRPKGVVDDVLVQVDKFYYPLTS